MRRTFDISPHSSKALYLHARGRAEWAHASSIVRAYGRNAAEAIAETFWPTRCAVCDLPGELLCPTCRLNLPYLDWWRACPRCDAPFGRVQCSECNAIVLKSFGRDDLPYDGCASAVVYDDAASRVVRTWKDAGERRLSKVMGELMVNTVPPAWLAANPVLIPVPATSSALRRRGFDHGMELAQAVANRLEADIAPVLARPKNRDQRTLARNDRLANMKSRFPLVPGARVPLNALIVDDVYTTGATLFAVSDALRTAGAQTIFCLTFARAW